MPWLAESAGPAPRPAHPPERRMADLLRALAAGAAAAAGAPQPGLAAAMADAATVLWAQFHRFDSAAPGWPDRDRFVVSPGHGALLLYGLLHLTGHEAMDEDALASHGRLGSAAGGQPVRGPGIEVTAGPLGQGLATAVGMALAERLLAARFGKSLVDHRTWVVATLGDLMEGVSHEAVSLAGHLRLEKLVVLLEDDTASADCRSALAGPEDPRPRFTAAGWAIRTVDAHDPADIAAALALAVRSRKPTLITCRTRFGQSWTPAASSDAPCDAALRWEAVGRRGAIARRAWLKRLAHHPQRAEFERTAAGRLPEGWGDALAALKLPAGPDARSTRHAAERLLDSLGPLFPELVGGQTALGQAALGPSASAPVAAGAFAGRTVHYGLREHGMAAAMNGLALHGGVLPYATAPLAATDAMRPALRLGAMMGVRALHVATHDSIGLGTDGAAAQPSEQLAALRAMPNLLVLRPADAVETAECCELALRRAGGPAVLVLCEQPTPPVRMDAGENRSARGAYVLAEADGPRQATLIASGSEVAVALAARALLAASGVAAAVVSMPAWALFARADAAARAAVLGAAPRFGIEAACGFGWERWLGEDGVFIGLAGFGASGTAAELFRHFGITPEAVAAAVRRRLARPPGRS